MKLDKDIIIPKNLEINPYVYLDIILKYESYLRLIDNFGGYMFFKHIYKFSSKGELQTFKDIHNMEEDNLIKIINVNNNNYVLLQRTALKFLRNKANTAFLQPPTSTQLKTSCYLAEYITAPEDFFNANPYSWFLEKYQEQIQKYKADPATADLNFLTNNKEKVREIKIQFDKSKTNEDFFSKLNTSKMYFNNIDENGIVNILMLDFERSKFWIKKALEEKIEMIFKKLAIYKGYNINLITCNSGREERLKTDIVRLDCNGLIFLKDINVKNVDSDRFFQATQQKESFLKDIDKLEIAKLQEKLNK